MLNLFKNESIRACLYEEGASKGDRVLVIIPRLPEAYFVFLGCLKAGIVPISCSEMLRASDLQYRMEHSSAKAVIAYEAFTSEVDCITTSVEALNNKLVIGTATGAWTSLDELASTQSDTFTAAATKRDDMAFLSYTSGTTGKPKGVVHSHGWGYAHIRTAASQWLCVREGDLVWATAAPGWQNGFGAHFCQLLCWAQLHLYTTEDLMQKHTLNCFKKNRLMYCAVLQRNIELWRRLII